jgi:adenine C2-methylase RlmN of 23S rRNA A2503 and tRNA A37
MLNRWEVAAAMAAIHERQGSYYEVRRFAVASIAPSVAAVEGFANSVRHFGLNCKFHLSLHSVDERTRRRLMPATRTVPEAFRAAATYQFVTHNQVEVHYTLIEGVNDFAHDAMNLAERLRGRNWTVKIIDFNPIGYLKSEAYTKAVDRFREHLHGCGITTEFYTPPGRDIGASCGQFIAEEYKL